MKANELRIGIYVRALTPYMDSKIRNNIVKIDEDFMEVIMSARNYDDIEPIPLTPELLEKCGFKVGSKYSNGSYYKKELVPHGYFLLFYSYTTKDFIYETIDSNDYGYNTPRVTIMYVHQLQNLYFSLTNEELIINI